MSKHSLILLTDPVGRGRLSESLRSRLKPATLSGGHDLVPIGLRLAELLGFDPAPAGLAATRFLGDTGQKADGWIAAADPVYLEPRLDHLCLKSQADSLEAGETERLGEHLNKTFGDENLRFLVAGNRLYLAASTPVATSRLPADVIDGLIPNKYLPDSGDTDAARRLVAEIEMCLHDHPVNLNRQAHGRPPVNSLWLWGGGESRAVSTHALPPLASRNPALTGVWELYGGSVVADVSGPSALPASAELVIDCDGAGADLDAWFDDPAIARIILLSRDGLSIDWSRRHGWRPWRRRHPELEPD